MSFADRLALAVTGAVLVATSVLLVLATLISWRRLPRPRGRSFLRRLLRRARLLLLLLPPAYLLGPPLFLASIARFELGTRRDEASYTGPLVARDGSWRFQSRGDLLPASAVRGHTLAEEVRFRAADGVALHGYLVPAPSSRPRFQAVLVHGLFRNALELERPASWLRELGGELLLLELRNHGRSGRAAPSFGLREAHDVEAAVRFLRGRRRDRDPRPPLLLYGVSLGAAAVALAAPRVEGLGGLVLDAPFPTLGEVFGNLLGSRRFGMGRVHRAVTLFFLEALCGFSASEVSPERALRGLAPDVVALVIGAGRDFRTPPDAVRRVFEALPLPDDRKSLWIVDEATHGKVFVVASEAYRRRLTALVDRLAPRR